MIRNIHFYRQDKEGSIIVNILIITLFLAIVIAALITYAGSNLSRARGRVLSIQAQYSAESGADAAIAILNSDPNSAYTGTGATETTVLNNNQYKATFQTSLTNGSAINERVIVSTGRVYRPRTATTPSYTRKIEVLAQRTGGSVVATGMISRNIIEFASSVKDVYAKDLYVNGYIQTDKDVNRLHAENIMVAGKNTSALNCSIGGPGQLIKPTAFSTPGQTKTNISVAYNNCISPPGNTSNSDFNVSVNQTNIVKIQSTYIPWSQYMDSSYTSGNCSDWTSGASPRSIPAAIGSKHTHYPDSASSISNSCGSSGNIALGTAQYNITDNVHIRANLCGAAACNPTFNNPTSEPKYIFVEGSINFSGVTSASGSGPIVLVSYGADPASKIGVCPLGGAIYLGNSGNDLLQAPQIYFVANNGLCFDKTKFGAAPSFGGISGKNIFISTNSGNPHDPSLNTDFPLSDVPVDLTWHAAKYRRL